MNVVVLALIVLLGWPLLSIASALAVGAMAGARDRMMLTPLRHAVSHDEETASV